MVAVSKAAWDHQLPTFADAHTLQDTHMTSKKTARADSLNTNHTCRPLSHPLITCPEPRVKSNGWLRSLLESNLSPLVYKVPV